MSMESYVFFDGAVPSVADFQAEMARLGFAVTIDPEVTSLEEVDGFVPMRLAEGKDERDAGEEDDEDEYDDEEDMGVELTFWPRDENSESFAEYDIPAQLKRVANFCWGSRDMDLICALFGIAAMASLTGGTVLDGEEGRTMDAAEAAEIAVTSLRHMEY